MTAEEHRDELLDYFLDCLEAQIEYSENEEMFKRTCAAWKSYYIFSKKIKSGDYEVSQE